MATSTPRGVALRAGLGVRLASLEVRAARAAGDRRSGEPLAAYRRRRARLRRLEEQARRVLAQVERGLTAFGANDST